MFVTRAREGTEQARGLNIRNGLLKSRDVVEHETHSANFTRESIGTHRPQWRAQLNEDVCSARSRAKMIARSLAIHILYRAVCPRIWIETFPPVSVQLS